MYKLQVVGVALVALGVVVLFLLRGPLYEFIVVVLNLVGIFVGFLLVLAGIVFILGPRWAKRRRSWGWSAVLRQDG